MLNLGGSKKKQDKKSKYSIVQIDIHKPTKKKYVEIDYEDIRKQKLQEGESSGDDERFHDKEALELVRRLEAKYGSKKTKRGKKIKFGTEEDFMDKAAGYDLEDAFIDDSEAYDELIPSTMDTAKGGFYVNKGTLHFKSRHDDFEDTDLSDEEMPVERKKTKKRVLVASDDEAMEEGDPQGADSQPSADEAADESSGDTDDATPDATLKQVSVPSQPASRMTGAPPSKKFASHMHSDSPSQRAAKAIKKRLAGHPPFKNRILQKNVLAKKKSIIVTPILTASPNPANISPTKAISKELNDVCMIVPSSSDAVRPLPVATVSTPTKNVDSGSGSDADGRRLSTSPTKRALPPLTDTLSKMVSEFKRLTAGLAQPGQKKRLQSGHIEMVIAIEEQCMKDGFGSHEKARVLNSLADYCGIQKNSLMARIVKKKEEAKAGSFSASTNKTSVVAPSIPSTSAIRSTSEPDIIIDKHTSPKAVPSQPTQRPAAGVANWTTQQKASAQALLSEVSKIADIGTSPEMTLLMQKMTSGKLTFDEFMDLTKSMKEKQKKTMGVSALELMNKIQNGQKNNTPISKTTTPSSSTTNLAPPQTVASALEVAGIIKKPVVPKVTLAEAVRKQGALPITFPGLSGMSVDDMMVQLNNRKTKLEQVVSQAVTQSTMTHKRRLSEATTSGRPTPKFAFMCTEIVYTNVVATLEVLWKILGAHYPNDISKCYESMNAYMNNNILPLFQGHITPGKLWVEYGRRAPERCLIVMYAPIQKLILAEKIELSTIIMKEKDKAAVGRPLKISTTSTLAPSTETVVDDEIQYLDERGDMPTVPIPPAPSINGLNHVRQGTLIPTNGASVLSQPSTSAAATNSAPVSVAGISNALANLTPADLAKLQQQLSTVTSAVGHDPRSMVQMQQALILQYVQSAQVSKTAVPSAPKFSQEEKAKRKQAKEDEKQRLIAQRKAEAAAQKQKILDERKQRMDEEKRQKAEEKAKKAEEERIRRLQEQQEREKRVQEEAERAAKEEQERKRREEEEQKQAEVLRNIKEQELLRLEEERRLLQMREEEENAALLLQEEISDDVPEDVLTALEVERAFEEERVRKQQEQGAAARAAAQAAADAAAQTAHSFGDDVKPGVYGGPLTSTTAETSSLYQGVDATSFFVKDTKPTPLTAEAPRNGSYDIMPVNNQQAPSCSNGFASPQASGSLNSMTSPMGHPVPASPHYGNNGNGFAYPGSHGSSVAQSPQQMVMTPPGHVVAVNGAGQMRSPFQQQHMMHQQSPYQQAGQSPAASVISHPNTPQRQSSFGSMQQLHQQQLQQHQLQMQAHQNAMIPHQATMNGQPHVNVNNNGHIQQQQVQRQVFDPVQQPSNQASAMHYPNAHQQQQLMMQQQQHQAQQQRALQQQQQQLASQQQQRQLMQQQQQHLEEQYKQQHQQQLQLHQQQQQQLEKQRQAELMARQQQQQQQQQQPQFYQQQQPNQGGYRGF